MVVEPGKLPGVVDTCKFGEGAGRHTFAEAVGRRKPALVVGSILPEVAGLRIEWAHSTSQPTAVSKHRCKTLQSYKSDVGGRISVALHHAGRLHCS